MRVACLIPWAVIGLLFPGQIPNLFGQSVATLIHDVSDMADGSVTQARIEAQRQAASGNLAYRSYTKSDPSSFSGKYTPPELSDDKKGRFVYGLALFSDDGCSVTVNGSLIHQRMGQGQHLPSIGDSFHVLQTALAPGEPTDITVDYSNIIYDDDPDSPGYPDIDGCTLFLYLLPCEMVPDFNRDGIIDDKDRGKITAEKPWRFWFNDDDDKGDVGGDDNNSDIPGAAGNGADQEVNGIRDLVDFFPIWLDIKQLLTVLPKDQFDYILDSESTALQYVETTLTKGDSDAYLKAELDEPDESNNPNGIASLAVKTITLGAAKLTDEFLQAVEDEIGGVLLIEAWKATDKPLKLVVRKKESSNTTCGVLFPVKIDEVEKMFRQKNIRTAVAAWNGRISGEPDRLGEPENYPDALCSNKNFIFVHGYNVNGEQARGWQAEVFKRMFWSGNRAKFYGVSWSGDRNQATYPLLGLRTPNFHHAVNDAFTSAQSLAQFVNSLQGEKTIAAHSLGNLMTSTAQSNYGMSVANFYLVNAAQSLEQHQADAPKSVRLRHGDWPNYQERTWASEWHLLPFPQGDGRKNLTWRGRVAGHTGKRYNFYSDVSNGLGDHVMRTPAEQTNDDAIVQFNALIGAFIGGDADGREAFCLQERLKGHFLLASMGSTYGGWRFTENYDDSTPPSPPSYLTPTATQANAMSDTEWQTEPVFDPGFYHQFSPPLPGGGTQVVRNGAPSWIADLTDATNGSSIAQQNRNLLLSEMFPARTLAVGGNPVPIFGARNIDMQSTMHAGWPAGRTSGNEPVAWWHGDLKDVAYTYVYPLFDAWVDFGELK